MEKGSTYMMHINQEMHRVVVRVIIFRDDERVLILQHGFKWTIPNGSLETDDYTTRPSTYIDSRQWHNVLHNAVRREAFNQTGLEILAPWLATDLAYIRNDGCAVLALTYAADMRYVHTDVVLADDAVASMWVNLEEAKTFDLVEGVYHELELAFNDWYIRKGIEP
jgi:8-oxo-dGTP pyrophosphatase MutT (NUDIX family)